MNEETVTITRKEYESLQEDARLLECLQAAGVDDWSGYDYALEILNEDE